MRKAKAFLFKGFYVKGENLSYHIKPNNFGEGNYCADLLAKMWANSTKILCLSNRVTRTHPSRCKQKGVL